MRLFTATLLLSILSPLLLANPIEVRDSDLSWPEIFALLDRDGCYKLKRDLGIEGVSFSFHIFRTEWCALAHVGDMYVGLTQILYWNF